MSEKRRDSKNRILRSGESQRKDGRYAYKYIDATGKPQFVYSWKLEATDSTPQGKRDGLSLREKEKQIRRDIEDAIIPRGGEMTVLDLVKKYLSQKTGVRHNTEANYNFVLNIIKKEDFGRQRIDRVKLSDAKCWLIKLQQDGRGYSSIHSIRGVVRPAFQMAVDDDLIRKNPFEFQLATVVVNDSVTREAMEDPVRGVYSFAPLKSRLIETSIEQEGVIKMRDMASPVIRLDALNPGEMYVLLERFNISLQVIDCFL